MTDFAAEIIPEAVRELAFGGISASYATVGTVLANPSSVIFFKNSTNADVYISFDGVNNHMRIIAGSADVLDERTNGGRIGKGTQFWCKQVTAPSSGAVIIQSFFTY
jgi:hypothetical protein